MRIILILVFLLIGQTLTAQQTFRWVKGGGSWTMGSFEEESAYAMCTDKNGNIYSLNVVGDNAVPVYADTFYQAPSAKGYDHNILVTSYTCDGTMRWAKMITSNNGCKPFGIVVDTIGHVFIAGYFPPVAPVGGTTLRIGYDTVFTSPYYPSTGLIQLDTNGNYKWIRLIGDNVFSSAYNVGYLANPLVLDKNANAHFLCYMKVAGIKITPTHTSLRGVYDLVYDVNGNMISDTRLDLDSQWYLNHAAIDPVTNKLYVTGQLNPDFYSPSTPVVDTTFAAAFDASRHLIWRHDAGYRSSLTSIALSPGKNLYFSAATNSASTAKFIFSGDSTVAPAGIRNIAVAVRADSNGKVRWMRRFDGGTLGNAFMDITLLPNEKSAFAGTHYGTVVDDRGRFSIGSMRDDPYLAIVDSSGDVQALEAITGTGRYDWGMSITCDRNSNIYIGGTLNDSIWAGTPPIPGYKSVGGDNDFFVMKYGMNCACASTAVATFTYSGTHTLSTTYTGTTAGLDSVIWDWGDGSALSKGLTSSHTYSVADTYRVCATVYTNCTNDIYCKDVIILCGSPATASFSDTGMKTKGFIYTGSTSTVDSVTWNYGDGSPKGKGNAVTHTYAAVGTYTVCVTAWSVCGSSTACKTVTITCVSAPTASFSSTGFAPFNVTYTGTTAGLDSVVWSFGDGGKAKGLTASHTYAAIGSYTVCVTAYTVCGSNKVCQTVLVPCISVPASAFTDTGVITLGATYTGSTAPLDSVVWNFGDGSATVKGLTALHTFTAVGVYTVCATAYNPCGSNVYCSYDTVRCITAPVASFSDTGKKIIGFTYTGTTDGTDSIIWNFGDGQVASGNTALHTYSVSGTYNVCVTIYTPCGIDSVCKSVTATGLAVPVLDLADIKVYPNPANDELNITGIQQTTNYRLLAITGVTIQAGIFSKGNNTLPINQLVPGIYMLEMNGIDGARKVVRVVKE